LSGGGYGTFPSYVMAQIGTLAVTRSSTFVSKKPYITFFITPESIVPIDGLVIHSIGNYFANPNNSDPDLNAHK